MRDIFLLMMPVLVILYVLVFPAQFHALVGWLAH